VVACVTGIIGGSGLYDLPGLENVERRRIASPWGEPSDDLTFGALNGRPIVFLPRHGRGHAIPPSEINYRANIDAMKRAGVAGRVSLSACGSYKAELYPGLFVLVDQFVDRTSGRPSSFFGKGCVAHVSMADPVSPGLADRIEAAARAEGIGHTRGGTYMVMEGPQFSTRAESELYRAWGYSVIGMKNMPEDKLAREAEICYATIAMVTDYDCWHEDHADVDVAAVIAVLKDNAHRAQRLVARLVADFPLEHPPCPAGSDHALEVAIMTPPDKRDPAVVAKLDAVAGRVLRRG
jgi:5'-methylthioadenosine phosphorylase